MLTRLLVSDCWLTEADDDSSIVTEEIRLIFESISFTDSSFVDRVFRLAKGTPTTSCCGKY